MRCPVVAHWGCLASTQRDEILRAAHERDIAAWKEQQAEKMDVDGDAPTSSRPTKRPGLETDETTDFVCGSCSKEGVCMGCLEPLKPVSPTQLEAEPNSETNTSTETNKEDPDPQPLLFRCITCKRSAHYAHLPPDNVDDEEEGELLGAIARYYQHDNEWQCADCDSFVYPLEKILAWRPYPPNAKEPARGRHEPINHKASLPREYLVKWENRSYRRAQWVPHMWLLARSAAKLKNFLNGGSKVKLLEAPEPEAPSKDSPEAPQAADAILKEDTPMEVEKAEQPLQVVSWSDPLPDAERRIPSAWRTVDRVLSVLLLKPPKSKKKPRVWLKLSKNQLRVESDEDESADTPYSAERDAAYDYGDQPSDDVTESIDEWEKRKKRELTIDDIDAVIWCFFKWDDLGYEEGEVSPAWIPCHLVDILFSNMGFSTSSRRNWLDCLRKSFSALPRRTPGPKAHGTLHQGKVSKTKRLYAPSSSRRRTTAGLGPTQRPQTYGLPGKSGYVYSELSAHNALRLTASTGFVTIGGTFSIAFSLMRWVS